MRHAACILALLVVLSPLCAAAVAATAGSSATAAGRPAAGAAAVAAPVGAGDDYQLSSSKPHTRIRVYLRPDGDARWEVTFRYELETENETAAFRRLRGEFVSGSSAAGPSITLFRTGAREASNAVGREMRITAENRTGTVGEDTGTLTLAFTWTNFLKQGSRGTLRLGDAFQTPNDGRWISSLDEGQRIVIVTPDGYTVNSTGIRAQFQNNSVIIDGPRSLPEDEEFVVVYHENDKSEPPWLLIGGSVVLLGAVAAAFLYVRRGGGAARDERPPAVEAGGAATDSGGEPRDGTPPGNGHDTGGAHNGPAAGSVAVSDAGDGGAEPEVDPSLLSDEERVEQLLERNGGRMKQANIVKQTGWSDAKVSQLLSSMTEERRVEKLRLGRENLISLPTADEGNDDDDDDA